MNLAAEGRLIRGQGRRLQAGLGLDHRGAIPPCGSRKTTALLRRAVSAQKIASRQRPTLPRTFARSTIGAEGLNCRVRNGNGCFPLATATGKLGTQNGKNLRSLSRQSTESGQSDRVRTVREESIGQAERPISTGQLNASLRLHLQPINVVVYHGSSGRPHLEVGFSLRCFQRLSFPDLATQRCRWRDNWYTRGSSIPVLSY